MRLFAASVCTAAALAFLVGYLSRPPGAAERDAAKDGRVVQPQRTSGEWPEVSGAEITDPTPKIFAASIPPVARDSWLRGVITDEGGDPVADAVIVCTPRVMSQRVATTSDLKRQWRREWILRHRHVLETRSGVGGSFEFHGLLACTYEVSVTHPDFEEYSTSPKESSEILASILRSLSRRDNATLPGSTLQIELQKRQPKVQLELCSSGGVLLGSEARVWLGSEPHAKEHTWEGIPLAVAVPAEGILVKASCEGYRSRSEQLLPLDGTTHRIVLDPSASVRVIPQFPKWSQRTAAAACILAYDPAREPSPEQVSWGGQWLHGGGPYLFSGLRSGHYRVGIYSSGRLYIPRVMTRIWGGEFRPRGRTLVATTDVHVSSGVLDVDVVIPPISETDHSLVVRAFDQRGQPADYLTLRAVVPQERRSVSTHIDRVGEGTYLVVFADELGQEAYSRGSLELFAHVPGVSGERVVQVKGGQRQVEIDFSRGEIVEVRVTAEGARPAALAFELRSDATGTVQFNQCEFERDRTRLGPLPEGSYDVFVRYGGVRLGSWPVEVAAGRTNSLVIEIPQLYDVEILTPPGFHELHSDVVQCFLHAPRVHLRVPAGEYLCSRIGVPIGVGNVTESTTLNFRKED